MDDKNPAEGQRHLAVLIDADNAPPAIVEGLFEEIAKYGVASVKRIYGDWTKPNLGGWKKVLLDYSIQPVQQFAYTQGKNATDMAMTIDAIDLLYQGKVDGFGIMSSDSDFTPLVTRLRQDGLTVYGFGSAKAPDAFQNACTRFIDIDALIAGDEEIDDSGSETPSSSKPDTKPRIDDEMIDLLGKSWRNAKRDAEGYARLSEVGQIAGNRSSFDVRNYGYRRLSDLLRSLEHFEVKEKDGHLVVKRLR